MTRLGRDIIVNQPCGKVRCAARHFHFWPIVHRYYNGAERCVGYVESLSAHYARQRLWRYQGGFPETNVHYF